MTPTKYLHLMFLTDLVLILFIFLFQCEWLLSGNKVGAGQDLEEGLDPESPIYKAIMSNPIVQLGLNNPRSLLGKKNMHNLFLEY